MHLRSQFIDNARHALLVRRARRSGGHSGLTQSARDQFARPFHVRRDSGTASENSTGKFLAGRA